MASFLQLYEQFVELGKLAELAETCEELEASDDEEPNGQYGDPTPHPSRRVNVTMTEFRRLAPEGKEFDREDFIREFFFKPEDFEALLQKLDPFIAKQDTNLRVCISSRLRLQATIKFLMGGHSLPTLEETLGIPRSTLSRMIPTVCEAIWQTLNRDYITLPQSDSDWLEKAQEFHDLCQYPYAVGILDGKLLKGHGLTKGVFNIILFALVDANHQFMFVEVGEQFDEDESKAWQSSTLKRALDDGVLNLPDSKGSISHHFISHDNYPLSKRMMKPYTRQGQLQVIEKIFNFRFSRASRVATNTFGVWSSRFRVLRNQIPQKFDNAVKTIKAAVVLHNYILRHCNSDGYYLNSEDLQREDVSGNVVPGSWEHEAAATNLATLSNQEGHRFTTKESMEHRDELAKALASDKLAPEQFKIVTQRIDVAPMHYILIQE